MKDQQAPIRLGAPGEDISLSDLRTIKLRFKKLHQMRLQRAHDFLAPGQQIFLDLLPLLFHGNYPLLPGYISSKTPAGLFEYSPNANTLAAAKKFIKGFTYRARPVSKQPIEALFIMGSAGSIAFSKNSDMDIWLCHDAQLSAHEIEELAKKAHEIERSAASLELEVHLFLMNCKQFREGLGIPISSESSGETQHFLLLEEFYRTSIHVAGKGLAWWLVPPDQEHNHTRYLEHLLHRHFIKENELIDFGGLNAVPAEEFISATLWHIYKSLDSPHKSLLKLLLMECYASEYPNPKWLCLEIKQAIYRGDFTDTGLDPYLLIYLKVETYLQQTHSTDRLTLARQNFFHKIMAAIEEAANEATLASRNQCLLAVAEHCQWPPGTWDELKKQRLWDIKKAITEHGLVIQQLSRCFRMIMGFAGDHVNQHYQDNSDLKLLGRKLSSFLEKKPGKIEIITTRNAVDVVEKELFILENRYNDNIPGWSLSFTNSQTSSSEDQVPVTKCRTLIEIFAWLVINGFYRPEQKIQLKAQSINLTRQELQRILKQLDTFVKNHFDWEASLANYRSANILIKSLIIVNMGNALAHDSDNDHCLISGHSDALSYGSTQKCLIRSIDRLSISSWSEITSSRHVGIEGLFDCLIAIINDAKKPVSYNDLSIVCYTPARAKSIILRLHNIFRTLVSLFSKNEPDNAPRYILPGGSAFYVFQYINKVLSYRNLKTEAIILTELSQPQGHFSQVHFDETVLTNTPVPLIYTVNKPQTIQIFYHECKAAITVYILDEKGALFTQSHNQSTPSQIMSQYSIFLASVLNRNFIENTLAIEYYEIRNNSLSELSLQPLAIKIPAADNILNLRITASEGSHKPSYTLYCNEQEFSSLDHGDQVFQATYQYIVQYRKGNADYPVYISDIDLPISIFGVNRLDQLQTVHYLHLKQKIEAALNPEGQK